MKTGNIERRGGRVHSNQNESMQRPNQVAHKSSPYIVAVEAVSGGEEGLSRKKMPPTIYIEQLNSVAENVRGFELKKEEEGGLNDDCRGYLLTFLSIEDMGVLDNLIK